MDVAIVLPTFNERENVPIILSRLMNSLRGLSWEAIFVDDDSPDGTAEVIANYARQNANIRLIHRVGRRGLASACIEGMMATQAPLVAVMDADLQHDDTILPQMFARLHRDSLDIVVGTRNAVGGSMGDFHPSRVFLSRLGRRISHGVCRCQLTDPMSGFFALRRSFLLEVVADLEGQGFKILVDLLASSRRPVRVGEVGYTFGIRTRGESKLNVVVGIEYLVLVANKLLGDILPIQFALFLLVGACGLAIHLAALTLLTRVYHVHFVAAQLAAAIIAMTENFFLNNLITFRERRLHGRRLLYGIVRFTLACSYGAWANLVFSRTLWQSGTNLYVAGLAGIVLGSVWNLSISSLITWKLPTRTGFARNHANAFVRDTGLREIDVQDLDIAHQIEVSY